VSVRSTAAYVLDADVRCPDPARLCDRRLIDVFDRYAGVGRGRRVLGVGCDCSGWLRFLRRERGCEVAARAVDAEPEGSWDPLAQGEPADQFDLVFSMGVIDRLAHPVQQLSILARHVRPGGRILSTIPNMHAWNGWLQRLASTREFHAHVLYDLAALRAIHDLAGFQPVVSGHAGFFDGYLSSATGACEGPRRRLHDGVCAVTSRAAQAWILLTGGLLAPETPFLSPHLYVVGIRRCRSAR
jgi:SAM-dependent methyltransferase